MATLDVTEILDDEDIASEFHVVRRDEAVSLDTGRATIKERLHGPIIGVVVAKGPDKNQRRDDAQMIDRRISVVTVFRLRAASDNVQPDIIIWDGTRYTITHVTPHTRFGQGFVKAEALAMQASNHPPA